MNFRDYAKDLRRLADLLDATADDLPLPQYDLPLGVSVSVPEAADVLTAAKALGVDVSKYRGHTTATARVGDGAVELKFAHITVRAMADYTARQAFAKSMPVDA